MLRVEYQGSFREFVSARTLVYMISDGLFRPPKKLAQWCSQSSKQRPKHT